MEAVVYKGKSQLAVAVGFTQGGRVKQIKDPRNKSRKRGEALRPGEEEMAGVNCAIDGVGYQARSRFDPKAEDPMQTISQIAEIVNRT